MNQDPFLERPDYTITKLVDCIPHPDDVNETVMTYNAEATAKLVLQQLKKVERRIAQVRVAWKEVLENNPKESRYSLGIFHDSLDINDFFWNVLGEVFRIIGGNTNVIFNPYSTKSLPIFQYVVLILLRCASMIFLFSRIAGMI